ncbi:universal stress protein [Nocardioides sp.]|uniref:universal stress protein n=1 Tax=Nocardioides sp. TaxID=35761 RepID=UPI00273251E7|nr:universal stress protein [Nocardioides sp.]MDP3891255.1 universal stress protein [Nocardioides sp.]
MNETAVVVAVDGSEANRAALAWAVDAASRSRVRLTVATVAEPWQVVGPYVPDLPESDFAQPIAERAAAQAAAAYPGGDVRTEVRVGHPVRVLQEVAAGQQLLVLGKQGLGALGRFFIGSTSIAVAGRADVPVVVVPGHWDTTAHAGLPVVVGVDTDRTHAAALRHALAEADRRRVPLVVVQAWEPRGVLATDPELAAQVHAGWLQQGKRDLEEVVGRANQEFPDVEVRIQQTLGYPVHRLLEAADGAQLVVVGREEKRRLSGFALGSVARGVLHQSETPVMVVPDPTT